MPAILLVDFFLKCPNRNTLMFRDSGLHISGSHFHQTEWFTRLSDRQQYRFETGEEESDHEDRVDDTWQVEPALLHTGSGAIKHQHVDYYCVHAQQRAPQQKAVPPFLSCLLISAPLSSR